MSETIRSYEGLEVWSRGLELVLRAYSIAVRLPATERYELSSQMRRCAVSIPSNIAEGHARRLPKPYLNHIHIALGSLAEWVTYLVVAERLGFITNEVFEREKRDADRLGQMLHGLARSLERRVDRLRAGLALGGLAVCGFGASLLQVPG